MLGPVVEGVMVGLKVEVDMEREVGNGHVFGLRGARGVKACEWGGAWIWNIFLVGGEGGKGVDERE